MAGLVKSMDKRTLRTPRLRLPALGSPPPTLPLLQIQMRYDKGKGWEVQTTVSTPRVELYVLTATTRKVFPPLVLVALIPELCRSFLLSTISVRSVRNLPDSRID